MDDDFDPTLARLQRTLASANSLFQRALQRAENLNNQPGPLSQDKPNTSPQKQKVWETSIQNLRRKLKTKNIGAVSEQSLLIDDVENRPLDANLIGSQVMGGSESSLGLSESSVSEDNRSEKSEIKNRNVLKATDSQIVVPKMKSKRKPITKKSSLGKENMSDNNDSNNPVVVKESDQPRPAPISNVAGQQVESAVRPKVAAKDAVNSGGPPAIKTLNFAETLVSKVVHDQEIVENHLSTLEQLHKRLHTMNEAFVSKQKDLLDVQSESVKQQAFKHIHFLQELNEKHIDWQGHQLQKLNSIFLNIVKATDAMEGSSIQNLARPYRIPFNNVLPTAPNQGQHQPSDVNNVPPEVSNTVDRNVVTEIVNLQLETIRNDIQKVLDSVEEKKVSTGREREEKRLRRRKAEAQTRIEQTYDQSSLSELMGPDESIVSTSGRRMPVLGTHDYEATRRKIREMSVKSQEMIQSFKSTFDLDSKIFADSNLSIQTEELEKIREEAQKRVFEKLRATRKKSPTKIPALKKESKAIAKTNIPASNEPLSAKSPPVSPTRQSHVHTDRPPSPLKPPNKFYNVRLSDNPIFLRRTSIKPPYLNVPTSPVKPPKSQVREVVREIIRAPSPVAPIPKSEISTMTSPPPQSPKSPISRIESKPVSKGTTLDSTTQTVPEKKERSTQMTPEPPKVATPPKKVSTKAVQYDTPPTKKPASVKPEPQVYHTPVQVDIAANNGGLIENHIVEWMQNEVILRLLLEEQQNERHRILLSEIRDILLNEVIHQELRQIVTAVLSELRPPTPPPKSLSIPSSNMDSDEVRKRIAADQEISLPSLSAEKEVESSTKDTSAETEEAYASNFESAESLQHDMSETEKKSRIMDDQEISLLMKDRVIKPAESPPNPSPKVPKSPPQDAAIQAVETPASRADVGIQIDPPTESPPIASEPLEQSSSNETTSTGGAVTTISTLVSDGEVLTEFYSEGEIVERIGPNMLKEIEASRENITQLLGIPKTTVTTLKSNTSDSSTGSGDSQSSTSCMADDEEMSSEQISIGEVDPSSRMKSTKPQLKSSRAKATETSKKEENPNSKSGRNRDLPNKDPTTLLKTKKKKEILQRLKLLRDSEDDLSKSLTSTKDSFSIGQNRDEGEHSIGEVPPGYSLSEGEIVPQRAPAVKTVRREDQTSEGEPSGMLSPGEVQTETKTKRREKGLKTSMSAESVRRVIAVQPPLDEHSFLLSSPQKGKEKAIALDNSAEDGNMSKSDQSLSSSEKISSVIVKTAEESPVKSLVPDVSFLEVTTVPQIHIPLDIAVPDSFFNAPKNGQASSSTTAWQLPDLKSTSPTILSEQFQSNAGKDKVPTNVSLLHDVEMSSTSFVSPHHPASSSHPMLPLPTFTTPSRKGPSHLSGDLDETIEIEEVSEVKYEDPRSLLSAISQLSSPVSVSSTSRSIGEIGLERLKSPTPLRTSVETEKWVESLSQVLDSSFRKSEFRTRASGNEEKRSEHSTKDENPLGESYLNLGTPSGQLPPVIADNVSHQVPSLISQVHDTEQDKGKLSDRSEISEVLNESVSDYKSASSSENFETRDEPQRTEDAAGSTSHHAGKSFEELTQTIDKVSEIESVSDSIISIGKQSS